METGVKVLKLHGRVKSKWKDRTVRRIHKSGKEGERIREKHKNEWKDSV